MRLLLYILFALPLLAAAQTPAEPKVVSGLILLNERKAPDFAKIMAALPRDWKVRADSTNLSGKTAVFSTTGATVMLAYWDYAANPADIKAAAGISWLWKTAEQEATGHQAQVVISVLGAPNNTVELYRLFTRVAGCVLEQTPTAAGVFMNGQYLLLSRGYYLEVAKNMSSNALPLYNWVYFGLLQQDGKSSCYTFGLQEFGVPELEMVGSKMSLQDAHSLMYDVASYGVKNFTTPLRDGQSVDLDDHQKVLLRYSDAALIGSGKTLKIE
jgi:Domain of unknown function (DUF4261)